MRQQTCRRNIEDVISVGRHDRPYDLHRRCMSFLGIQDIIDSNEEDIQRNIYQPLLDIFIDWQDHRAYYNKLDGSCYCWLQMFIEFFDDLLDLLEEADDYHPSLRNYLSDWAQTYVNVFYRYILHERNNLEREANGLPRQTHSQDDYSDLLPPSFQGSLSAEWISFFQHCDELIGYLVEE